LIAGLSFLCAAADIVLRNHQFMTLHDQAAALPLQLCSESGGDAARVALTGQLGAATPTGRQVAQ